MIQDSGDRTEFSSGAVRDIKGEDKGYTHLLPLDICSMILAEDQTYENKEPVLDMLYRFINTREPIFLFLALDKFGDMFYGSIPEMLLEVSIHYKEGCQKYGERNWEKGIPINSFLDSAIRHYLKLLDDQEDERHDRAFVWNLLGLLWTIKHHDDLWQDFLSSFNSPADRKEKTTMEKAKEISDRGKKEYLSETNPYQYQDFLLMRDTLCKANPFGEDEEE